MNNNDVKKGDKIVKIIIGGGFETCSIQTIEEVTKDTIFLEGADGYYERDTLYAYDLTTGRACESYIPGFSSRLIVLEQ